MSVSQSAARHVPLLDRQHQPRAATRAASAKRAQLTRPEGDAEHLAIAIRPLFFHLGHACQFLQWRQRRGAVGVVGRRRARVSSCDAPRHPSGDQASQPARHGGQIGQITLQRRAPARTEVCTGSKFEGQVKMTVHASSMKSCSVICPICDVAEKLGHSWSINGGTSCTNQGGRVSWCMRGADSQAQAHAPRSF